MDFIRLFEILYNNRPDTLSDYRFFMMLIDNFIRKANNPKEITEDKEGKYNPFGKISQDTVERYIRRQNKFNKKRLSDVRRLRDIDRFATFIGKYFKDREKLNIETEIRAYIPDFNEDGEDINYLVADLFTKLMDELIGDPGKAVAPITAPVSTDASDSSTTYYYNPTDQKIHIGGHIINLPPELLPPDDIDDEEIPYVNELLSAYADASGGTPLTKDEVSKLKGKYKDNFVEQRINYYSAVRICRLIRDSYANPDKELNTWKTQTFDFISDTYRDDYPNGYKRLVEVLKKVVESKTQAAVDGCDQLIQPKERKGVCHLLANDGVIHWVQKDE